MCEGGRKAVKSLPIGLVDPRAELPPHRRAWIRCQQLELRRRRSEIDRVLDRRRDRRPVVLKKAKHVERGRNDAEPATLGDDSSLMRRGNRPASRSLERVVRRCLDSETDRRQPGAPERLQEFRVQSIETRLALEPQTQTPNVNLLTQLEASISILRKQRITKNDIRPPLQRAQILEFVSNVVDAAGAVRGKDAVRAIRAELRAPTTGEQRKGAAGGPPGEGQMPAAGSIASDQIPSRERKRGQIV